MTKGFEKIATEKKEDVKNIPKANQGDAMESFIKREYDTDVKTPEERQGDAMEAFIEREDEADDKKEKKDEPEGEILEIHDLVEENEIIEMEDLEDKELIKLSNELKKAREDYNKNTEKTAGAWEKIKNIFPKLVLGENATSVKEAKEYSNRYKEARNNLLKYQTEKLKRRKLPKEKRIEEVADLAKHYNEDEQFDSLNKETGEKFKFSIKEEKAKEEKAKEEIDKTEKNYNSLEKNKKKAIGGMFEKYKINEKDNYYDQSSSFADKLIKEVAMGEYKNWEEIRDKKIADKMKDVKGENIQKIKKYFENILGKSAEFKKDETVKKWVARIIKESLEANK